LGLDYEKAGVLGLGKDKNPKHFSLAQETHSFSLRKIIQTPFGNLYYISDGLLHSKNCDGVGTKVLVAQLAGKHDTIGIDAVAMVANDCIRTGAKPIALTNIIDAKNPSTELVLEILKGIAEGAKQASCAVVGGETASLPEVLSADYTINCDCVGEVGEEEIILSNNLKSGDVVIGVRSSGLHSNGISLARKALFKKWGGKYDEWQQVDGLEKELVLEVLTPTKIYVKKFFDLLKHVEVKSAVHITGDAYKKFSVLKKGFVFNNFFPQPIFELVKEAGGISDEEMFRRFNMGWGFAVIVEKDGAEKALQVLGRDAEEIGRVTDKAGIVIEGKGKRFSLE